MAEFRADKVVTDFLVNTCGSQVRRWFNLESIQALSDFMETLNRSRLTDDCEMDLTPVTTGSVAEFYIEPMLSCIGDHDVMMHRSDELAIPAGTAPSTHLPGEFDNIVRVYEIVDSEFPGYVYLDSSYLLIECTDEGRYVAVEWKVGSLSYEVDSKAHGPARMTEWSMPLPPFMRRIAEKRFSRDSVYCVRCLSWPSQAADWPTRQRSYGWPDSATVGHVVSNGCDLVRVAHRNSRTYGLKRHTQHRLSFSRAEVVLLNSWTPVQQTIYHILRVFVKIERLTDSALNSDAATLSNYHFKTLMMWAAELKPRSWWTDDLNLVRLSVELLHTMAIWLTDARCPHYFVNNCNLFDRIEHQRCSQHPMTYRLMNETVASLANWFITNYIRRCALQDCPEYVSRLFDDACNGRKQQNAVSAVVDYRLHESMMMAAIVIVTAEGMISGTVSRFSLTVPSWLFWMRDLRKIDQRLCTYFTAITFLHVAYKATGNPLTDELLDVLSTTCLQSNNVRRCRNARHSSVLSLSQAAKLMRVVANNSHSTVQLIEIELSKAYLYRALRCKDSHSDSIYCLANVYLAVLYCTTGQYQTAIDHCTLVTRSQDHSQCSSNVAEGEILPKIDDEIDTVLGLAVFYQYLRTAALNEQQTQHVSVFTTELFAHYLHTRCLSISQHIKLSLTDEVHRHRHYFHESLQVFPADLLLLKFVNPPNLPTYERRHIALSGQAVSGKLHQFDTSVTMELLQKSGIDHLTTFRQMQAEEFVSLSAFVTTDFEAMYAYKRGDYQRCFQLSSDNVCALNDVIIVKPRVYAYPEFIQLMDDDIVSLIGLIMIVNTSRFKQSLHASVSQFSLSLYLMTQCQIKLNHSVTSMAQTLDHVEEARRKLDERFSLDQLLLELIERKVLSHINSHQ